MLEEVKISKEFFDALAPVWDKKVKPEQVSYLREIFRSRIPALQSPVLDLGSGTGILLSILDFNTDIIECDISAEMLKQAKRKTHRSAGFVQSDGHQLPFANESFLSVICFAVFPHFYDWRQAAREIRRILKPGGFMVVLHLMGHEQLNQMHGEAGEEVEEDVLLPADRMASELARLDFEIEHVEEKPDLYLIRCFKPKNN